MYIHDNPPLPIGTKVRKISSKPFKSGKKVNTVKGYVNHSKLNIPCYTFEEDDTLVEVRRCVDATKPKVKVAKIPKQLSVTQHDPDSMKVFKVFSIEEIHEAWKTGVNRIQICEKYSANLRSQRLELFFNKGLTCVHCGVQGAYFNAEMAKRGTDANPHLNLYTAEGILMTKDHIIPKSKGGKNHLSNYQTMCSPCNWNKGSN